MKLNIMKYYPKSITITIYLEIVIFGNLTAMKVLFNPIVTLIRLI